LANHRIDIGDFDVLPDGDDDLPAEFLLDRLPAEIVLVGPSSPRGRRIGVDECHLDGRVQAGCRQHRRARSHYTQQAREQQGRKAGHGFCGNARGMPASRGVHQPAHQGGPRSC
jgi:hypothetical protein